MMPTNSKIIFICSDGRKSPNISYELGLVENGFVEGGVKRLMDNYFKLHSEDERAALLKRTFKNKEIVIFLLKPDERDNGYHTLKKYLDSQNIKNVLAVTKISATTLFYSYSAKP